jgi:hypothetical protein
MFEGILSYVDGGWIRKVSIGREVRLAAALRQGVFFRALKDFRNFE